MIQEVLLDVAPLKTKSRIVFGSTEVSMAHALVSGSASPGRPSFPLRTAALDASWIVAEMLLDGQ